MRDKRYPAAAAVLFLAFTAAAGAQHVEAGAERFDSADETFAPGIDLPDGEGKHLLETACTKCHDLAGLSAYKGYWGRERWASMVATMRDHGAELDESQAETIVDYLTAFFGPASGQSNRGLPK